MVRRWFEATGHHLDAFEAHHLERLSGLDGDYRIDVTVRFKAFSGAKFLVLVECKRHRHPIKRREVELLEARLRSTGAHKGFVIATTSFQKGAREYAEHQGIALVQVVDREFVYVQLSANRSRARTPGDYPPLVGFCMYPLPGVGPVPLVISEQDSYWLSTMLDDIVKEEDDA